MRSPRSLRKAQLAQRLAQGRPLMAPLMSGKASIFSLITFKSFRKSFLGAPSLG